MTPMPQTAMPRYRVYVLDDNGSVERTNAFECANDMDATQKAKQLFTGHTFELWQQHRFVTRINSDGTPGSIAGYWPV